MGLVLSTIGCASLYAALLILGLDGLHHYAAFVLGVVSISSFNQQWHMYTMRKINDLLTDAHKEV